MDREITYATAGVDIDKSALAIKAITEWLRLTFKQRENKVGEVLEEIGHFANLVDIGNNRAIAIHTDGVGTKVLLAQLLNKYDTIGIDLVAMNVNDMICVGAEPIAMVDYIATQEPDPEIMSQIGKGLAIGAEEAGIAIVGGETATLPEIIKGAIEKKGFDLAGTCIGIVEKNKIITGEKIQPNDIVLGLKSSGIHSNGLTLARKVLLEISKLNLNERLPDFNQRVGEELLKPTKIYVKPVLELIKNCEIHGLSHITGGGFLKLKRIGKTSKIGFILDALPQPQPIFRAIQKFGNISNFEMYRTFNMGIGFCIVLPKYEVEKAKKIVNKYNIDSFIIGKAVADPENKLEIKPVGVIS